MYFLTSNGQRRMGIASVNVKGMRRIVEKLFLYNYLQSILYFRHAFIEFYNPNKNLVKTIKLFDFNYLGAG